MFHIKLSVFKRTCFTAYIHSSYAQPDKPCVILFRVSGNGRKTTENIQIVKGGKKTQWKICPTPVQDLVTVGAAKRVG